MQVNVKKKQHNFKNKIIYISLLFCLKVKFTIRRFFLHLYYFIYRVYLNWYSSIVTIILIPWILTSVQYSCAYLNILFIRSRYSCNYKESGNHDCHLYYFQQCHGKRSSFSCIKTCIKYFPKSLKILESFYFTFYAIYVTKIKV